MGISPFIFTNTRTQIREFFLQKWTIKKLNLFYWLTVLGNVDYLKIIISLDGFLLSIDQIYLPLKGLDLER